MLSKLAISVKKSNIVDVDSLVVQARRAEVRDAVEQSGGSRWPRSKALGQRILCASTKQSSMLRTRGTSGAVRALEVRKGPIRKAGEVQSAR